MKRISKFLIPACLPAALLSCEKDEPAVPGPSPVTVTDGTVFVLHQGNYYNGIEGSLHLIATKDGAITPDAFSAANQRSLGATPQCGVAIGSKIYIGTNESHTIEVINRKNMKSLKQILLDQSTTGKSPRSMVADGGKIYISMFEGYVARLDTLTDEIDGLVEVGANPEIMCTHKGKLYVPNSEGMNYLVGLPYGETASVIDLATFKVESTVKVPLNPKQFFSNGAGLYLLAMGDYSSVSSAVYEISGNNEAREIAPATVADVKGERIYIGNNPYGGTLSYSIYDTRRKTFTHLTLPDSPAPASISSHPLHSGFLIHTYKVPAGGFADYNGPGCICEYDENGLLIKKYDTGCGASMMFY